jgi:DNA-binding CsgD family transcriptional regulator
MATRPLPGIDPARLLPHMLAILEDVPVGLLLLDENLRPLWYNAEAAQDCAVWNLGERPAAALRPRTAFRVPAGIEEGCRALGAIWSAKGAPPPPQIVSEHSRGLHARIKLLVPTEPGVSAAYHIQLDYRRPRGDRHRPLSPGAVALLARLSASEREVAMRVREGLGNREIAAELRRSPLTVKTHLASIFEKLAVTTGRARVAALLNR